MSEVDLNNIYHRINEKGLLEAVDLLTGRIVAVQHDHSEFKNPNDPKYTKVTDLNGNTVYIANELVASGKTPFDKDHGYSTFFADLIIQKVVEGCTLTKACKELDLAYSIVNRWKNTNVEFRKRLEDAYRDRAEKQADEILEIAEETRDAKARIDARKWAAEKFNPEKFGQKTKISGDKDAPLQFVIQTGVPERGADSSETEKDVTPRGPALAGVETEEVVVPSLEEVEVE